jgi:hypothetical protein
MELVLVEVAHFEPVQVQVLIEGTYPVLTMNLPRVKDDLFREALQEAKERLVIGNSHLKDTERLWLKYHTFSVSYSLTCRPLSPCRPCCLCHKT